MRVLQSKNLSLRSIVTSTIPIILLLSIVTSSCSKHGGSEAEVKIKPEVKEFTSIAYEVKPVRLLSMTIDDKELGFSGENRYSIEIPAHSNVTVLTNLTTGVSKILPSNSSILEYRTIDN